MLNSRRIFIGNNGHIEIGVIPEIRGRKEIQFLINVELVVGDTFMMLNENELTELFRLIRSRKEFEFVTGESAYEAGKFEGYFEVREENQLYDIYYVDEEGGCSGIGLFHKSAIIALLEHEPLIWKQISRLHVGMQDLENALIHVIHECYENPHRAKINALRDADPILFEVATNHFDLLLEYMGKK